MNDRIQWTYEAVLDELELAQLRRLLGVQLDSVWSNGLSATVCAAGLSLHVCPEEVATPSPSHRYADVNRPRILPDASAPTEGAGCMGRDLGKIVNIALLRSRVTFSPKEYAPPTKLLGATIPEGTSYGLLFLEPNEDLTAKAEPDAPDITLDFAIELSTDKGHVVTVYTKGTGYFIHVAVDAPMVRNLGPQLRRHPIQADN